MVERLCRNCHFQDNFNEYKSSVQKAIDSDAIDMLEILIPAGNAKKLQPLHIACRLAKLESAELLLSAGFSCFLQDGEGRTPLHLCSLSRSLNSGLCATLLSLSGKKALTMRDSGGLTPLHLAAAQNNLHVIEALMNNGADITITSSAGKTPYQIAMESKNDEALQLLKQLVSNNNRGNSRKGITNASRMHNTASTKQQSQVEYDRIMQVWERFFENAFKRLGMDPDELDDDTDRYTSVCAQQSNMGTTSKSKTYKAHNTAGNYNNYNSSGSSSSKAKSKGYHSAYSSTSNYKYPKYDNWTSEEKHSDSLCADYPRAPGYNSSSCAYSNNSYNNLNMYSAKDKRFSKRNEQVQYVPYDTYNSEYDSYEAPEYSSKSVAISSKSCRTEHAYTSTKNVSYRGTLSAVDDNIKAFEWFQWVVCYSEDSAAAQDNSENAYYVLNKYTGETVWLSDHLNRFLRSTLLPCEDWSDFELHMQLPLPTTLREIVTRGWLTYYERAENICKWISLPTKSVELHLPLGMGEDATELEALSLSACEADTLWYAADQTCAAAWVLVVCTDRSDAQYKADSDTEDDEENVVYFYRNRVTGETSWEAPADWDKLLSSWGYWTLCCNEDSCEDLYW